MTEVEKYMKFQELRALARAKIDEHRFPSDTNPLSVSGSRGIKPIRCSLCDEFVDAGQIAYKVIAESDLTMGNVHVDLHFRCHAAWQLEVAGIEL